MGYRFIKKYAAKTQYIRLDTASVVRAAAAIEGLVKYMPNTEDDGGEIPREHHEALARAFREQAEILVDLADYFEDAEDLRWSH